MGTLADFRRQYPQYDDMNDVELADALHKKYYSDIPKADVFKRLEVKTPAAVAAAPAPASMVAEVANRNKYLNEYAADQKRQLDETLRLSKLPGVTASMRENASGRIEEYRKTLGDIRGEKDYMQRTGTLVPERSFGQAAMDQLKGFGAGAVRTVAGIPSLLGAVGIEAFGKASEQVGEGIVKNYLAPDESDAAQFSTFAKQGRRLSEVAGSVAPAFATRGASRLGMAAAGSRAVPAIARVEQAAQLALGAGPGAQQQRQAIERYEQETGTTVNPVVRAFAQALGVAIGASEVLTLDAMMARVPSKLRGSMTAKIASLAERVQVGGMSPKAAAAEARALVADIQQTARGRIGVAALEEGTQESGAQLAQNVVERAAYNSEKDITEGVEENFTYGAIVGGGLRGGVEGVNAVVNRGKAEAKGETDLANSPQVEQEFYRLVTVETQALRDQNPDLTQRQAYNQVVKDAGRLYDTAIANTLFGAEGGADVDTEVDVVGGVGAGTTPDLGTPPPAPGAADLGEVVTGGLGQSVSSVSVPTVGEGAGVAALVEPTAKLVKATVPTIEQAFTDSAIDFEEVYGIKKLNAEQKKQAARIVIQSPEVDPYDAIDSVLKRGALLRGEKAPSTSRTTVTGSANAQEIQDKLVADIAAINARADELKTTLGAQLQEQYDADMASIERGEEPQFGFGPSQQVSLDPFEAAPSVDQVAVAPVVAAIEQATAPTGSVVPSLAETAARDLGITEAPAPEVVAEEVAPEPAFEPQLSPQKEAAQQTANPSMFNEGVRDIQRGAEPLTDQQILDAQDQEALDAYKAGMEYETQRTAEPVAEEVALEPVTEEVAPELVAEEAVAEPDPFADALNAVEDAYWGEDADGNAQPEIDEKAYNLLVSAAENKRGSPEKILDALEQAKNRFADADLNQRYRRDGTGQGVTKEAVQKYINGLISGWRANINVNVVDSIDDLPPALKEAVIRDAAQEAQGFVTAEGDIYILASNLADVSDAAATLYHEGLGHLGLRALFNKRLDGVLQQIYDGNKKLRDEADTWFEENSGAYPENSNPRLRALEEVLAIQSEEGRIDANIWAKITAIIKDMGRRVGIKSSFSDREVRAILAMAHDQIINGPHKSATIKGLRYMLRAWHGSPHDFDEFSTGAIGTGAGTLYGWGLYFSSKKEIAEYYRDELARKSVKIDVGGRTISKKSFDVGSIIESLGLQKTSDYPPAYPAEWALNQIAEGMSVDEAITDMQYNYDHYPPASVKAAEAAIRAANPRLMGAGKLYETNINTEEERLLNWDKPFSEQSEFVQERLAGLGLQPPTEEALGKQRDRLNEVSIEYDILLDRRNAELKKLGVSDVYVLRRADIQALADNPQNRELQAVMDDLQVVRSELNTIESRLSAALSVAYGYNQYGEGLYSQLEQRLGSPKAASQALLLAGIRGNVYAGDSSGVKNYVIFNGSDIEVANKYQRKKKTGLGKAPTPKVVSGGKLVVLTEAQKRTALAKAKAVREKMNRIQKRIAATNDTADVLSGGIDLAKLARGDTENLALLRGAIDTLDIGKWKLILPTLSTEDIFRILKGRIPGLTEADRIIRQDVTRFQTREYLKLADELEQVAEFLKKYPKAAQALSDLEFAAVAYQVDPTKAPTPEAYAKLDKKTKELQIELGNVTAGDAKGKKEAENKIARRFAEIKSVYVGVPGDERVHGWRDLGRPEFGGGKGREIFKLLRDGHRRDLEAKYNALRDRLKETKKDKALDEALEKLEAQFKPAMDQVIYFPAMRFGSYYARVGTGANSIFKMFETQTQRNQFVRIMKARNQEVTETGNVEDLRSNFQQVSGGPIKEVLDLFDGDPKDIGALKSQVFDLWLQTMSAGDMRKHMAPRKMRAGYSTDILKNFANFRRSSINDVKRAKFGEKLRTEISRAKDGLEGAPDREKMNAFIKEIELRTRSDLMPPERGNPYWEGAIELGNKMAFYQYLANPKTALIQLTQLHIVVLPILAQKYGHVKATAALAKYGFSSLGGFVVSSLKATPRPGNKWTFDWKQPNLLDNPISALKEESDPELYEVLSEGWNEGRDLNLCGNTFANQIGGYGNADPQQSNALQELMKGRVHTAAWRGSTFAFEAMGTLMHQMESVNREATYMAALELAYRENKKNGQTHAEAKKNAIEAAVETTLAATFDFSSYNKPRVLTAGVGRLAGQFMSYPYFMTSLLARNMYTAIKVGELEPGERLAAIEVATGALFNIGLYAGITGVPLYGFFTTLASLLMWAFGDDDEEEGGLSYLDEDGNIKATYNIDWWVRNVWIPKTFGPDGTVANLFGLDDDTAELVARSVEKGPISAITDIDLSNSIALDFMFFLPRESRADTPEGKVVDYTFSIMTGAAGNMVMDYIKAGKDLMNGYTNRALERLPKLFGNIAKANRFATEGQTNYNRELVGMDVDFWSSDKAILQALSFASTEADQKQQQNYEAKSIKVKVGKARADFLDKLRKTALDRYQYGSNPETDAAQQQIVKDWVTFNQTYPTDVIGIDSFYEVQNNAVSNAAESYGTRGLPLDEKTPYLRDLYLRRLESEKK